MQKNSPYFNVKDPVVPMYEKAVGSFSGGVVPGTLSTIKETLIAPKARLTKRAKYPDTTHIKIAQTVLPSPELPTVRYSIMPSWHQAMLDSEWRANPQQMQVILTGDPLDPEPDSHPSVDKLLSTLQARDFTAYEKQWLADMAHPYKKLVSHDEYAELIPEDPLSTRETTFALSGDIVETLGSIPSKLRSWWTERSEDEKTGWKLIAGALGIPVAVLLGKGIIAKYGTKLWYGSQISKISNALAGNKDSGLSIQNVLSDMTPEEIQDMNRMAGKTDQSDLDLLVSTGLGPAQAAALGSTDESAMIKLAARNGSELGAIPVDVVMAVADIGASMQERKDGTAALRSFPTIGSPDELITRRIPNTFVDPDQGIIESPLPYLPSLATEPVLSGGKLLKALGKAKNFLNNNPIGKVVNKVAKKVISVMPGGGLINTALEVGSKFIPEDVTGDTPDSVTPTDVAAVPEYDLQPGAAPIAAVSAVPNTNFPPTAIAPVSAEVTAVNHNLEIATRSQLPPGWNIVMTGAPDPEPPEEQKRVIEDAQTVPETPVDVDSESDDSLTTFRGVLSNYPGVFPDIVRKGDINFPPTRAALNLASLTCATAIRDNVKYKLTTNITSETMRFLQMVKTAYKSDIRIKTGILDDPSYTTMYPGAAPLSAFIAECCDLGAYSMYMFKYYIGKGCLYRGGALRDARDFFEETFAPLCDRVTVPFEEALKLFDSYTSSEWRSWHFQGPFAKQADINKLENLCLQLGEVLTKLYVYLIGVDNVNAAKAKIAIVGYASNAFSDFSMKIDTEGDMVVEGKTDAAKRLGILASRVRGINAAIISAAKIGSFTNKAASQLTPSANQPGGLEGNRDDLPIFKGKEFVNDPSTKSESEHQSISDDEEPDPHAEGGQIPPSEQTVSDEKRVIDENLPVIMAAAEIVEDKSSWASWERALAIVGASASVIAVVGPIIKKWLSKGALGSVINKEEDFGYGIKSSLQIPLVI